MTKLIMILFIGILNSNPNYNITYSSKPKSINKINYDDNRKLTWKDYTIFNGNRKEAAVTATEISYSIEIVDGKINVAVSCVFDKSKSNFVKKDTNNYILNHEQKHFDISYMFAMKFVKTLQKQEVLTIEMIEKIYNDIYEEWTAFQNKYDDDTKNSKSKEMQSVWDKHIESQLKYYSS